MWERNPDEENHVGHHEDISRTYEQIEWHRQNHRFYIIVVRTGANDDILYHTCKPAMWRWSPRLGYALSGGPAYSFWMNRESAEQYAEENCNLYGDFPLKTLGWWNWTQMKP